MGIKNFVDHHSQGIAETLKLSPPVAVSGASASGVDLQTWIIVGTLIYTVLLVIHKIIQIARDVKKFRNKELDSTMSGEL